MKTLKLSIRTAALSLLGGSMATLGAADYTGQLPVNSQNWEEVVWSPNQTPGTGDRILDVYNIANHYNVYLNGNRTIDYLGRTRDGVSRFYNGSKSGEGVNPNSFFSITSSIHVAAGTYLFRSTPTGTLTVESPDLIIGNPDVPSKGSIEVGAATGEMAGYTALLNISNTTTIYDNSVLAVHVGSMASLGQVSFKGASSDGVVSANGTVRASGLNSDIDNHGTTRIVGAGTLILDRDAAPSEAPAIYYGYVSAGVSLIKEGTGVQILAGANGSTHTGGTLIRGGGLSLYNESGSGLGTGAVTIEKGGFLGGSGIVALGTGNTIYIEEGGALAPSGDGGTGPKTLRLSGQMNGAAPILTMDQEAEVNIRFTTEGHDQISFLHYTEGDVSFGETIFVNLLGEVKEGLYILFTFHEGDEESDYLFSGLTDGLALGTGGEGYQATFYYDHLTMGGEGTIALELTAIPEPGPGTMLLLGVIGLCGASALKRFGRPALS